MNNYRIKDMHPGKYHEGMKVALIVVEQLSEAGSFDKGDKFDSCLRLEGAEKMGMYNGGEEAIQEVEVKNGLCEMTMNYVTSIKREQSLEVLAGKEIVLDNNDSMSKNDRKKYGNIYPIYRIKLKY